MDSDELYVLWTSGELDVAMKVVLRYIENVLTKETWKEIDLLIWGPSVKLAAEDDSVKVKLENLMKKGLKAEACIVCAEEYGVSDTLKSMGVRLEMTADTVTEIIKKQKPLISF